LTDYLWLAYKRSTSLQELWGRVRLVGHKRAPRFQASESGARRESISRPRLSCRISSTAEGLPVARRVLPVAQLDIRTAIRYTRPTNHPSRGWHV